MRPTLELDPVPWLAAGAVAALGKLLTPNMRVLEYGSGGSTVWLARQGVQLISLEHNETWYQIVRQRLIEERLGVTFLHEPPDDTPQERRFHGQHRKSYKSYVLRGVAQAERLFGGTLDLLLVDGRSRVACVILAGGLVRPGGLLVLDDAQRKRYHEAILFLNAGWVFLGSYGTTQKKTAFWRKL